MKIVAGNWKMHKSVHEVEAFFRASREFKIPPNTRTIVAPSPTLLAAACQFKGSSLEVFSQNVHWEDSGAFTGEISPVQLLDLGVRGSLVAHSERRQFFAESLETALKRAQAARKHSLEVIFCIGESLSERQAGLTNEVLKKQLKDFCLAFKGESQIMIAYEPVWAIGTGVSATEAQVRETHAWIQEFLDIHGLKLPILYGGSIKASNFKSLINIASVDGGLIGGASLDPDSFQSLLNCLTQS